MPLQLYNTLTKEKQEFKPLTPGKVKMYACGVTVYDECHIGHARSLYIFDVFRRYLKYREYDVTFVRNITDIDDKIINRANELGVSLEELTQKYIHSYHKDLKTLAIEKADVEPKATLHIKDMVKHIQGLIEKDYAYVVEGDVYFRVRKFKDYGKLSGQSLESMFEAVRIEVDPKKQDPLDFALWKKSKQGEPQYDSPWSGGRPGWHIECSAMSTKYLGESFDIHAGGLDLVFPHHENEIAQSQALSGKQFAKYWMHHGLLTINGQKMGKSLENFVTIRDFIKKYKYSNILKFFFLATHYRHPADYTDEKIQEAKKTWERLFIMLKKVDDIFRYISLEEKKEIERDALKNKKFEYIRSRFQEAMDDDFNTPQALAVLQELITKTNVTITRYGELINKAISKQQLYFSCYILFPEIAGVLGLSLSIPSEMGAFLDEDVKILIVKRDEARRDKDFELADKIRDDLKNNGIVLEDAKDGKTTWRRKL